MTISKTVILGFAVSLAAFAADPFVGTWKYVPEKSQAASPRGVAQTRTFELTGPDQFLTEIRSAATTGQKISFAFDGKEHSVREGVTGQGSRVDSNHTHYVSKSSIPTDQDNQTYDAAVSADGKTMTVAVKGSFRSGAKADSVLVYEKQ